MFPCHVIDFSTALKVSTCFRKVAYIASKRAPAIPVLLVAFQTVCEVSFHIEGARICSI